MPRKNLRSVGNAQTHSPRAGLARYLENGIACAMDGQRQAPAEKRGEWAAVQAQLVELRQKVQRL